MRMLADGASRLQRQHGAHLKLAEGIPRRKQRLADDSSLTAAQMLDDVCLLFLCPIQHVFFILSCLSARRL